MSDISTGKLSGKLLGALASKGMTPDQPDRANPTNPFDQLELARSSYGGGHTQCRSTGEPSSAGEVGQVLFATMTQAWVSPLVGFVISPIALSALTVTAATIAIAVVPVTAAAESLPDQTSETIAPNLSAYPPLLTVATDSTAHNSINISTASGSTITTPNVTNLIPASAIGAVLIDTTGNWQDINRFDSLPNELEAVPGLPFVPQPLSNSLESLPVTGSPVTGSLIESTPLDHVEGEAETARSNSWLSDWAGDRAAFVVLPNETEGADLLTIVPIANPAASRQYWDDLLADIDRQFLQNSQPAPDLLTETYRDVTITSFPQVTNVITPEFGWEANPTPSPNPVAVDEMIDSDSENNPDSALDSEPGSAPGSAPATDDVLPIAFAVGQWDDRLVFAPNAAQIMHYIDAITPYPDPNFIPPPQPQPTDSSAESVLPVIPPPLIYPAMLNDVPEFQQTATNPNFESAFIAAYFDSQAIVKAIPIVLQNFLGESNTNLEIEPLLNYWNSLEVIGSHVDSFAWFDTTGLRLQTRSYYDKTPTQLIELSQTPHDLIAQIPASSYASFTLQGLDVLLPYFLAVYDQIPEFHTALNQLRTLVQAEVGQDLESEIIPWMDGAIGMFAFPVPGQASFLAPLGNQSWGVVLQTSDRTAAEATFTRLDQLWSRTMEQQALRFDLVDQKAIQSWVDTHHVEGFEVSEWMMPFYGLNPQVSVMARTWLTDNMLLLTNGLPAVQALVPHPYQSLDQSYNFQAAIAPFPEEVISYAHINLGTILALVNQFIPPSVWEQVPVTEAFDPVRSLRSIRSISEATSATENYAQDDIHINLSPRRE